MLRIDHGVAALVAFSCLPLLSSKLLLAAEKSEPGNLIANGQFQTASAADKVPAGFDMIGDVSFGTLGDQTKEANGRGFRLLSAASKDGKREGDFTTTVKKLPADDGRWFRLRVRGMAQEGFQVDEDDLYLNVDFFRDKGTNSLDHIKKSVFALVEQDRKALADAGTNKKLGPATWRSYDLEFRTPFPEVDTLRVGMGFGHGKGAGAKSEFWVSEIALTPISVPADYTPPHGGKVTRGKEAAAAMVPLGGRWYYDPPGADRTPPAEFNAANADRLFYLSDRLEAPFADNVSAWLRKGYLDAAGAEVQADRFVPDNVIVSFDKTHLIIHSKSLPNHPTAVFPDRARSLDGNPNYIQEKHTTSYIPLEPKENPQHVAMKNGTNSDSALPRGPIGIAANGIVFFNPFDASQSDDAIWRLDRCCGHPAPNYLYHYHKYPVCVKTPWSDDGDAHSPLIGFAYDGFPIYGPYESKGLLAKDDHDHPLNEFNIHFDKERGWHYHVTPGQFPHIIGGYWGVLDEKNRQRGPGPGRGPGMGRPGSPGGPPDGPPRP